MTTKINTTIYFSQRNYNGDENVFNALKAALGADHAETITDKAEDGEKVDVTLTTEQFARLVIARRSFKVEKSLKWSRATVVVPRPAAAPLDLTA